VGRREREISTKKVGEDTGKKRKETRETTRRVRRRS
jgi:hypothetical protein